MVPRSAHPISQFFAKICRDFFKMAANALRCNSKSFTMEFGMRSGEIRTTITQEQVIRRQTYEIFGYR